MPSLAQALARPLVRPIAGRIDDASFEGVGVPDPPEGFILLSEQDNGVTYYFTETVGGVVYYFMEAV